MGLSIINIGTITSISEGETAKGHKRGIVRLMDGMSKGERCKAVFKASHKVGDVIEGSEFSGRLIEADLSEETPAATE